MSVLDALRNINLGAKYKLKWTAEPLPSCTEIGAGKLYLLCGRNAGSCAFKMRVLVSKDETQGMVLSLNQYSYRFAEGKVSLKRYLREHGINPRLCDGKLTYAEQREIVQLSDTLTADGVHSARDRLLMLDNALSWSETYYPRLCRSCGVRPRIGPMDLCTHCTRQAVRTDKQQRLLLQASMAGEVSTPVRTHIPGGLYEYSTDVLQYKRGFYKTDSDPVAPMFFGLEIEVETLGDRRETLRLVEPLIGEFFIFKRDGSLHTGTGVELVSVPCTLQFFKETVIPKLQGLNKYVRGWMADNAGMHIHASSANISVLEHGKMLALLNSTSMARVVSTVAGRQPKGYTVRNKNLKVQHGGVGGDDHHDMLSISGSTTYELRIFRSTVAPAGVLRNLEFYDAVIKYAKSGVSCADITADSFLRFLQKPENSKEFKELITFFMNRGIISTKRKAPHKGPIPDPVEYKL